MVLFSGQVVNFVFYDNDSDVDQWEVIYGVKGYNSVSWYIVYVGGIDKKFCLKDICIEC